MSLVFPENVDVEKDVPCAMADGVVLRSDIYRPLDRGPLPALLIRLPYDKAIAEANAGFAHPSWYAARGYVVVVQDVRGCFASDGDFYPFRHEAEDGSKTVDWVAQLPGCDGRVAMYGSSYMGITQLLVAARRPRGLAAICPTFSASDVYNDWVYPGGTLSLAFVASWTGERAVERAIRHGDLAGARALMRVLRNPEDLFWHMPLSNGWKRIFDHAPFMADWLHHPTYDEYWSLWAVEHSDRIDVPGLHVAGWYDIFLRGTVRNFMNLRGATKRAASAQKLVIGPWMHTPLAPLDPTAGRDAGANLIDEWQVGWLDHLFRGTEWNGSEYPVSAFITGLGWRDFDDWPPSSRRTIELFLHSNSRAQSKFGDGTLNAVSQGEEPPDVLLHDPRMPVRSQGGHSCCTPAVMGPADQRVTEESRSALVYTSDEIFEPVDLIGNASLRLFVACDSMDANFVARLCLVDEDGISINLQEGHERMQYRSSLVGPIVTRPGEIVELKIDLGPVGVRVPKGHRIRLQVTNSDFPKLNLELNLSGSDTQMASAGRPATHLVFHDISRPSRLLLEAST